MEPTRRYRHALRLGALGAAAGAVTGLTLNNERLFGDAAEAAAWLLPGLVYGAMLAAYLPRVVPLAAWRRLVVVLLAMASWYVAVKTAGRLYDWTESLVVAGAAGGLVGAVTVAASAWLVPALARRLPLALVVALGVAVGAALTPDFEGYGLYIVWQGLVAAALGLALDTAAPA